MASTTPATETAAAPAAGQETTPAAQAAGTSLYVGDLENNVSEAMLYELFSAIGPVVSIRVCRDLITRRSLGYGYINFQVAADANRALEMMNHHVLNGKPIRVSHSQRDPSTRKSGLGNVFIKNLDKSIDNKTLHDTFAQFGSIISAKIANDSSGQSKGYGFVQYESAEAAKNAIESVNEMLLKDKQVYVGPFQRRTERTINPADVKFTNVYVKNLDESVDDAELRTRFEAFGAITSAVVVKDGDKSKCFGFVNFEKAGDASGAVDALNEKEFNGKAMFVGRAQKKGEREAELKAKFDAERRERLEKMAGANLYVKNLDDTVTDEKLRELFSEHGTVTSCRVMKDANGNSRGSGFVAFATAEEATRAVTEMNNKMAGQKPLYVALAQRKEDRRMRLQAQFHQRQAMGSAVQGNMPMYPPQQMGPPGAQIYYGQPPPGMVVPPQPQFFQGGVIPPQGGRPGGGPMMPPYMVAVGPQGVRNMGPGGQQRQGGRRGGQGNQNGGRGQQNRPQVRYNQNVRNMQGEHMPQPNGAVMLPDGQIQPGMNATAPVEHVSSVAMLSSQLAAAPVEQQRMLLGEALYPLVERIEPATSAKVTGMLLEMDQAEVLHLIESPDALQSKVMEALGVLKAAGDEQAV